MAALTRVMAEFHRHRQTTHPVLTHPVPSPGGMGAGTTPVDSQYPVSLNSQRPLSTGCPMMAVTI